LLFPRDPTLIPADPTLIRVDPTLIRVDPTLAAADGAEPIRRRYVTMGLRLAGVQERNCRLAAVDAMGSGRLWRRQAVNCFLRAANSN
jgi:hypothetical protein